MNRDVVISGYGLLSPQGTSIDAIWRNVTSSEAVTAIVDSETYSPFHVYPVPEYDLGAQVARPGDQRAMGPMMQYGAYAAGVALEQAGIKGDDKLLAETHLIVAAPGGERDWDLDEQILGKIGGTNDRGALLNEELSDGLRPTLFLAQLPNLFAGNISIIHGVSGSSRTFMGEEAAGADAVRIAYRRIAAGQGETFLVGGASNGERPDLLQIYHSGATLLTGPLDEIWRRPDAGMCLGSAGAFLVLESRESAERRGVRPLAVLRSLESGRCRRDPGNAAAVGRKQFEAVAPLLKDDPVAVLSGATGAGPATAEELGMLGEFAEGGRSLAVRGTGQAFGNALEAAFIQNLVLGIVCLQHGTLFPPLNPAEKLENRFEGTEVTQVLVTGWGHAKGEAMGLLERFDG